MKENINPLEPKYNTQAVLIFFLFTFLLWVIVFYLAFPFKASSTGMLILLFSGLIMGAFVGTIAMFGTRRKTIKISFSNKEEFLDKINVFLFQVGYTKDFNTDNFLSYKPSFRAGIASGRINITLNKNEATISGAKKIIMILEKNI